MNLDLVEVVRATADRERWRTLLSARLTVTAALMMMMMMMMVTNVFNTTSILTFTLLTSQCTVGLVFIVGLGTITLYCIVLWLLKRTTVTFFCK